MNEPYEHQHSHNHTGSEKEAEQSASPVDNVPGIPEGNTSTPHDAVLLDLVGLDPASLIAWLETAIHDKFEILLECIAVAAAIAESNACGFELDELDFDVWSRSVTADLIQVPFSFTLVGESVDECQPSFPVEGNAVVAILPGGQVQLHEVDACIDDEVRLDPELEDEL